MNVETLLLDGGLLSAGELADLRQRAGGERLDRAAVEAGLLDEDRWLSHVGDMLGLDVVDVSHAEVDRDLLNAFPTKAIFRHECLPLHRQNGHIVVAVGDPARLETLDDLSAASGFALKPVLGRKREVLEKIKDHLGVGGDTINELVRLQTDEDDDEAGFLESLDHDLGELAQSAQVPSVIRLVNELLIEAVEQKASDVHIEPQEKGLTIRFRVDGLLRVQPVPPEIHQFGSAITTRLKIMSRLNIAERRLPQDGRIKLRIGRREIDVRVSIIPMVHGEGVVMRLLDKDRMVFDLDHLDMPASVRRPFEQLIRLPHGIVLVTGPTGSGKSTTLYSSLNEIKGPDTKVITVEDPVEYQSAGISQIQVHAKIGLTFAAGLRSILRHDPDVILIGEIRDGETAQSAIQASLTGHLVFSTLHTNDAPGSVTRLVDMGVEPYLVASTVEGVLAQRLVRRLCPACKAAYEPKPEELPPGFEWSAGDDGPLYHAAGCRECRETGYRGRQGIFELLVVDDHVRDLTSHGRGSEAIRKYAVEQAGMTTLRQSGFELARAGVTSLEEVARVTKGDVS